MEVEVIQIAVLVIVVIVGFIGIAYLIKKPDTLTSEPKGNESVNEIEKNMTGRPISPWAWEAERKSPDKTMTVFFEDAMEVAMGAPTRGTLSVILSNGQKKVISEDSASSFVWSDDSKFIAYSKWTRNKNQNLCVFNIDNLSTDVSPDEFRVLELRNFSGGKIEGIDSPIYQPRTISLEYKQ